MSTATLERESTSEVCLAREREAEPWPRRITYDSMILIREAQIRHVFDPTMKDALAVTDRVVEVLSLDRKDSGGNGGQYHVPAKPISIRADYY